MSTIVNSTAAPAPLVATAPAVAPAALPLASSAPAMSTITTAGERPTRQERREFKAQQKAFRRAAKPTMPHSEYRALRSQHRAELRAFRHGTAAPLAASAPLATPLAAGAMPLSPVAPIAAGPAMALRDMALTQPAAPMVPMAPMATLAVPAVPMATATTVLPNAGLGFLRQRHSGGVPLTPAERDAWVALRQPAAAGAAPLPVAPAVAAPAVVAPAAAAPTYVVEHAPIVEREVVVARPVEVRREHHVQPVIHEREVQIQPIVRTEVTTEQRVAHTQHEVLLKPIVAEQAVVLPTTAAPLTAAATPIMPL